MITMGIDVGSLLTKVVALDGDRLIASGVVETTGNVAGEIQDLVASVLSGADLDASEVEASAGTGSGAWVVVIGGVAPG